MKNNYFKIIIFLLFSAVPFWSNGTILIGGVERQVDTLEYRQIGPGTVYTRMNFPEIPLNVYTLTMDMGNDYNIIETFQGGEKAGKTEAMTSAYNRLSSPGHQSLASVNANFWIVPTQGMDEILGVPHSGCIRNGIMVSDPNEWQRELGNVGFTVMDKDKKAWIENLEFEGRVMIENVGNYNISEINRVRKTDELVFFNEYLGQDVTRTDDNGTEVFIKLADGESWGVNKDVTCVVTRIIKDKGANALEPGECCLSGNGRAKVFLENLSVGNTLKINMDIFTTEGGIRPDILQMVTGNGVVLKNGELTDRNYDGYNSTLYPRTGIGMSQDRKTIYFIVIDKKGNSIGANTETMCQILKHAGAWNIASMDGGGSAQMMIEGAIVNNPADGKERAVANGWMVFSTAPEDQELKSLEFDTYNLEVPVYASFIPQILGYNQYGVLVDENVSDFTLSCDPSLGTVSENGKRFTASSKAVTGYLTATSGNGATVRKLVTIIDASGRMKNDSVIADNAHPYSIEVVSKIGKNEFLYNPSALSWKIENPEICKIEEGVLTGLKNGSTEVSGSLGDFTGQMKVRVEIPSEATIPVDDMTGWTMKSVSSITDLSLEPKGGGQGILGFTYKSGRAPYVEMDKKILLYSLPDTLKLLINSEVPLLRVQIAVGANGKNTEYLEVGTDGIPEGVDYPLNIPLSSIVDEQNRGDYPARIEYIKYMINTKATNGRAYKIQIKDFSLVYKDYISGVESVQSPGLLGIYPNPVEGGSVRLLSDADLFGSRFELYDQSGKLVLNGFVTEGNFVSVKGISSGLYILKISTQDDIKITKLLINRTK
ncbi:MAG: phosphodiester glycosidase family protein [Barnesiella sp.]